MVKRRLVGSTTLHLHYLPDGRKKYLSEGYAGLKPAYKRVDPAIRDLIN
ncbi:MAG: hypothetical protein QMB39_03245 [Bacteroidales bacterium]